MDLILDFCDEHFLDSIWASITPTKLPLDGLAGVENATAALRSLNKQALLQTTSSIAAAVATGSYTGSGPNGYPDNFQPAASTEESWVTVSAWPRDDWRRQFISVGASAHSVQGLPQAHAKEFPPFAALCFDHDRHSHHVLHPCWILLLLPLWVSTPASQLVSLGSPFGSVCQSTTA